MSAVFIVKFNDRPVRFFMDGRRKAYECPSHHPTPFTNEAEGWRHIGEYRLPIHLCTVEPDK